jgi:hypothetical protein
VLPGALGIVGHDREGIVPSERMMRRYAAVTDQTLRAAAEAVSGAEVTVPVSTR